MGRPALGLKETKVFLKDDHKQRVEALYPGKNNVLSKFVRDAVEVALQKREAEPNKRP